MTDRRRLIPSAWNTVGPFFPAALLSEESDLTRVYGQEPLTGERIEISGNVLEANAKPAVNIIIELWQANAAGEYREAHDSENALKRDRFVGFGRAPTDANGSYRFVTIKPGGYSTPDGRHRAPHLMLSLLGSGLMRRLVTRMYFPDEATNERDSLLTGLPESARTRLTAQKTDGGYRFDIVLRGEQETPFFVD